MTSKNNCAMTQNVTNNSVASPDFTVDGIDEDT